MFGKKTPRKTETEKTKRQKQRIYIESDDVKRQRQKKEQDTKKLNKAFCLGWVV